MMKIGVYGLGRFGAFWAAVLQKKFSVIGYNRSERPIPASINRGTLEEVCRCDILFLCTAISSMDKVAQEISPLLGPNTIVADTCSVKVAPMKMLKENLPEKTPIMATHPMFGPDSASQGIQDLPIVLSPVRIQNDSYHFWTDSFQSLGLKVIEMTPEEHDREAAYTQGITHFLGRMLKELDLKESPMATKGYKALLEIVEQTCNDPWQLFLDLQSYNPFTAEMRNDLEEVLGQMTRRFDSIETWRK